jgi:hypothetical protein
LVAGLAWALRVRRSTIANAPNARAKATNPITKSATAPLTVTPFVPAPARRRTQRYLDVLKRLTSARLSVYNVLSKTIRGVNRKVSLK